MCFARNAFGKRLVVNTECNKICHASNIIGSMEEKEWMKHECNLTFNKHVAHRNTHIYVCVTHTYKIYRPYFFRNRVASEIDRQPVK